MIRASRLLASSAVVAAGALAVDLAGLCRLENGPVCSEDVLSISGLLAGALAFGSWCGGAALAAWATWDDRP